MFFLNESIKYVVLDFDTLDEPFRILSKIAETDLSILVLAKELEDDEASEILAYGPNEEVSIATEDFHTVPELIEFLTKRKWTFEDVFITGERSRVAAANGIAIGTIYIKENIGYEDIRRGTDLVVTAEEFDRVIDIEFNVGNAGEVLLDGAPHLLPGSSNGATRKKFISFRSDHPEFERAYTLGRFFLSDDTFLNSHLYTQFIKKFKSDPDLFSRKTSNLLKRAILHIEACESLTDYILTHIPKKPRDQEDRNQKALLSLRQNHNIDFESLLECRRQFTSQKDISGATAKRENVRGKFQTTRALDGEVVLLFDDIYTSGATVAECAGQLIEAGASRVIPLTLAVSCLPTAVPLLQLTCSKCGSSLIVRFNGDTGTAFWGCPGYDKKPGHTNHNYAEGITRLRALWHAAENPSGTQF